MQPISTRAKALKEAIEKFIKKVEEARLLKEEIFRMAHEVGELVGEAKVFTLGDNVVTIVKRDQYSQKHGNPIKWDIQIRKATSL